ncbi:CPBP family intramembrane glutamic endopeptidase [Deltaproteobacteria bacterium TL4]
MSNFHRRVILIIGMVLWIPSTAWSVSTAGCIFAGIGELAVPGLGYAVLGNWDKAITLGGLRWAAYNKAIAFTESKNYEEDPKKIYLTQEAQDGGTTTDVFMSRETFYGDVYTSIYGNLLFITFYDLYDEGCESNPDIYLEMLAPFKFWHWGGSLKFWIPTLLVAQSSGEKVTYHVDEDLTQEEMLRWSFVQYQLVGIGEEMLFRGFIQNYLFEFFSGGLSKPVARWSSILLGSALFGVAHNGAGFSATPQAAFAMGVVLGWIYHPAEGDFDLDTAIAVHSWWDTIIAYRMLTDSTFVSRTEGENAENYQASAYIPLFYYATQF